MKTVVIKRYQNRKLYNTELSSYVTLTDILKMVLNNRDVMVLDNKSKRDITNKTLHTALFENQQKNGLFDRETLIKEIKETFINGGLVK